MDRILSDSAKAHNGRLRDDDKVDSVGGAAGHVALLSFTGEHSGAV